MNGHGFKLPIRVTRQRRCQFGFYLLTSGERIHFRTRTEAIEALRAVLSAQRFQIVSVSEYSRRKSVKAEMLLHETARHYKPEAAR